MIATITKEGPSSEYRSDYGWTISLPAGWEKLDDIGSVSITGYKPVVFSTPVDWSVAITWMRSARPWPREVVSQFEKLLATDGPVPLEEADTFVKTVFGAAGTVTEARTTVLKTGERALEVIEFIGSTGRPRCGYQLLMAVPDRLVTSRLPSINSDGSYFDRLVFYADAPTFARMVPSVRESCRNFERTSSTFLRLEK